MQHEILLRLHSGPGRQSVARRVGRAWFHIHSQARGSVGLHAETGGSMGLDLWGLPGATPFTWEDNNAIKRTNLLNGGRRQTFRRTRHAKCSVRGVH